MEDEERKLRNEIEDVLNKLINKFNLDTIQKLYIPPDGQGFHLEVQAWKNKG